MKFSNAEVIVLLALIVSVFGLFVVPGNLFSITGFGITGEVKVNITEVATLNVTTLTIDFSNGTVESSLVNCTLASNSVGDPTNCFKPAWSSQDGPQSGGFKVENVGNVQLNVTLQSTKTAATFFGIAGGKYAYKCLGNGTEATEVSVYVDLTAAVQNCTWYVPSPPGTDGFMVDINITVPATATGYKNDTITIIGVKA